MEEPIIQSTANERNDKSDIPMDAEAGKEKTNYKAQADGKFPVTKPTHSIC